LADACESLEHLRADRAAELRRAGDDWRGRCGVLMQTDEDKRRSDDTDPPRKQSSQFHERFE